MLVHRSAGAIYLDVAAGVTTFVLAGRYFEAWSRQRSGNALRALAAVGAKDVAVIDQLGFERRRPVAALGVGDRFIVRPGETVATDGEVVFGQSAIDRSVLTGESQPLDVGVGDLVVGGTVSISGRLVVRATKVGGETQLAQMLRLVEHAQNEKAAVQRLADRVCNVFVPAVLLIALLTLASWLLLGYPPAQAVTAALAVLVIACPCALGLATPAALYVAAGEGAQAGIFFKGYHALEASKQIDTVVLDKTGTVTEGRMKVTDVVSAPGTDARLLLRWAGALEQASEHPVARAIAARGRCPKSSHSRRTPASGPRARWKGIASRSVGWRRIRIPPPRRTSAPSGSAWGVLPSSCGATASQSVRSLWPTPCVRPPLRPSGSSGNSACGACS
jgi:Cu+-exporting ATPase